jgi:hypothetical protein
MADQVTETDEIREAVRARYAAAAENVGASADPGSSCCGPADAVLSDEGARVFGASLYDEASQGDLPDTATMASLGCGNPTARSPSCTPARRCSTSAPAEGSTSCSPPSGSARPARPTDST